MSYEVPNHFQPQIDQVAQAQHITADEALERIIVAGLEKLVSPGEGLKASNSSLFGSVKGPGAHGSKKAVDQYLTELRSEW